MTVLRIYDPPECDEQGVPLDWERCRACNGTGKQPGGLRAICAQCDGHGSLKAAALAELRKWYDRGTALDGSGPRCEDCGHPMSEGTWEGPGVEILADHDPDAEGLIALRQESGEKSLVRVNAVHHSRCDEGCRHGGPGRVMGVAGEWVGRDLSAEEVAWLGTTGNRCEASWRQVDVRTLGWPHDLRPEKLAILCLRCYAERKR